MRPLPLTKATEEELLAFHSREYLAFLAMGEEEQEQEQEEWGLGYDCPLLPSGKEGSSLLDWCKVVAGGSLTAASHLLKGKVRVAINWGGGWHHAHRDRAAGFCYVNDAVLAIHRLQQSFPRILYIDIDVHHGDGVEEAFSCTDRVATLSIHQHEAGFFPGSGSEEDQGFGKGRGYSVNVPLKEGLTDSMLLSVFKPVFEALISTFQPSCLVVQAGADCLAGDPMGGFNLTLEGPLGCLKEVLSTGLPLLLLGGGGYHPENSARLWTSMTALVLDRSLESDIPEEEPFFERYGPGFELEVVAGCRRNKNSEQEVQELVARVVDRIQTIGRQEKVQLLAVPELERAGNTSPAAS